MPAWLLSVVLPLILKFGLPYVLLWLKKRFPWIPIDAITPVLENYQSDMKEVKVSHTQARRRAKLALHKAVSPKPELSTLREEV